jgi:hypothetical protein
MIIETIALFTSIVSIPTCRSRTSPALSADARSLRGNTWPPGVGQAVYHCAGGPPPTAIVAGEVSAFG